MNPSQSARSTERAGQRVCVFSDHHQACAAAADWIALSVRENTERRGRAVLGLATGATPLPVYSRLIELHRLGRFSTEHVSTYNLDEYYPISPLDPLSYRAYMHLNLFQHLDLPANRTHLLDGTTPEEFVDDHCKQYDRWIEAEGGLDLQLLGIGRNGHIGFNEPTDLGEPRAMALPTRRIPLHPTTRQDAVREFGSIDQVPTHALTLGIQPILAARSILILAFGSSKREAVQAALTGPATSRVPASLLRHSAERVVWMIDDSCAEGWCD